MNPSAKPWVGITCDTLMMPVTGALSDAGPPTPVPRYQSPQSYTRLIIEAGGVPVLLPCRADQVEFFLQRCDAFVLTGGDDPMTGQLPDDWPGRAPTHTEAHPVDEARQTFDLALLAALDETDHPLLGVCLGMQYLALHHGGTLDQHLPDRLGDGADAHARRPHRIDAAGTGEPMLTGEVYSSHHQAVADPGEAEVIAQAPDGVIEAIRVPDHQYRLGVQWHPEKTTDPTLGVGLFRRLVAACR